jgi:hypothetical protein
MSASIKAKIFARTICDIDRHALAAADMCPLSILAGKKLEPR